MKINNSKNYLKFFSLLIILVLINGCIKPNSTHIATSPSSTPSPTQNPFPSNTVVTPTPSSTQNPFPTSEKTLPIKMVRTYYNPLPNIIWYDTFENGLSGWSIYDNSPGKLYAGYLPNETNSHGLTTGGQSGGKLMTLETVNGGSSAIKRTSWLWKNKYRIEAWLVVKNYDNPGSLDNPDMYTNDFVVGFDTQIGTPPNYYRTHFSVRYLNADKSGKLIHQWVYLSKDLNNDIAYQPMPGNSIQELTYNEKFKYDFIYLRLDIDIGRHEYVEFQSNDRIWNLRGIKIGPCVSCGEENVLNNLLNAAFSIRSWKGTSYMFIDSIVLSADNDTSN